MHALHLVVRSVGSAVLVPDDSNIVAKQRHHEAPSSNLSVFDTADAWPRLDRENYAQYRVNQL